jgi:ribosomal protein S18 acetylase RimI-like enzyme
VTSRWGHVYSKLAELHPKEPHWYLSTLGIDPRYQRKGLASALLDHWLREVDREHERVYLETDHRQSLSFYLNRGFRVCDELKLLGVPIWRMLRSTDSGSS